MHMQSQILIIWVCLALRTNLCRLLLLCGWGGGDNITLCFTPVFWIRDVLAPTRVQIRIRIRIQIQIQISDTYQLIFNLDLDPLLDMAPISDSDPALSLKGVWNEISASSFFHESGFPQAPEYPLWEDSDISGRRWCLYWTAMKRRIYRHLTHIDERPLSPQKLVQTKTAISPTADSRHGRR